MKTQIQEKKTRCHKCAQICTDYKILDCKHCQCEKCFKLLSAKFEQFNIFQSQKILCLECNQSSHDKQSSLQKLNEIHANAKKKPPYRDTAKEQAYKDKSSDKCQIHNKQLNQYCSNCKQEPLCDLCLENHFSHKNSILTLENAHSQITEKLNTMIFNLKNNINQLNQEYDMESQKKNLLKEQQKNGFNELSSKFSELINLLTTKESEIIENIEKTFSNNNKEQLRIQEALNENLSIFEEQLELISNPEPNIEKLMEFFKNSKDRLNRQKELEKEINFTIITQDTELNFNEIDEALNFISGKTIPKISNEKGKIAEKKSKQKTKIAEKNSNEKPKIAEKNSNEKPKIADKNSNEKQKIAQINSNEKPKIPEKNSYENSKISEKNTNKRPNLQIDEKKNSPNKNTFSHPFLAKIFDKKVKFDDFKVQMERQSNLINPNEKLFNLKKFLKKIDSNKQTVENEQFADNNTIEKLRSKSPIQNKYSPSKLNILENDNIGLKLTRGRESQIMLAERSKSTRNRESQLKSNSKMPKQGHYENQHEKINFKKTFLNNSSSSAISFNSIRPTSFSFQGSLNQAMPEKKPGDNFYEIIRQQQEAFNKNQAKLKRKEI